MKPAPAKTRVRARGRVEGLDERIMVWIAFALAGLAGALAVYETALWAIIS
jgi:hypothetical protein